MSLEQYKDANRKELWEILQIQVERIAELESYNAGLANESYRLQKRIAELEKERDVRDLDQRAKGIEDALNDFMHDAESTQVYVSDLDSRVDDLNTQAEALKEQGE